MFERFAVKTSLLASFVMAIMSGCAAPPSSHAPSDTASVHRCCTTKRPQPVKPEDVLTLIDEYLSYLDNDATKAWWEDAYRHGLEKAMRNAPIPAVILGSTVSNLSGVMGPKGKYVSKEEYHDMRVKAGIVVIKLWEMNNEYFQNLYIWRRFAALTSQPSSQPSSKP